MGPTSKGRGGREGKRGRERGRGERKGREGREPLHYKFLATPLNTVIGFCHQSILY